MEQEYIVSHAWRVETWNSFESKEDTFLLRENLNFFQVNLKFSNLPKTIRSLELNFRVSRKEAYVPHFCPTSWYLAFKKVYIYSCELTTLLELKSTVTPGSLLEVFEGKIVIIESIRLLHHQLNPFCHTNPVAAVNRYLNLQVWLVSRCSRKNKLESLLDLSYTINTDKKQRQINNT